MSEPITEQQIRDALVERLEPLGTVVEEVTVRVSRFARMRRDREARLDVALFSDAFHGYEIKSDQDTLKRLGRQLEVYGRVCATVTVVAGKYASQILHQAPDWVGVVQATGGETTRLQTLRPSLPSPQRSLRDLCESLWNTELKAILKEAGTRGYSGYGKDTLAAMVCDLSESRAYAACLNQLRNRAWKWWRPEAVS